MNKKIDMPYQIKVNEEIIDKISDDILEAFDKVVNEVFKKMYKHIDIYNTGEAIKITMSDDFELQVNKVNIYQETGMKQIRLKDEEHRIALLKEITCEFQERSAINSFNARASINAAMHDYHYYDQFMKSAIFEQNTAADYSKMALDNLLEILRYEERIAKEKARINRET